MAVSFVLARPKPQRTTEGTPRLFTRCGLAGVIFEHPAWSSVHGLRGVRIEFFEMRSGVGTSFSVWQEWKREARGGYQSDRMTMSANSQCRLARIKRL